MDADGVIPMSYQGMSSKVGFDATKPLAYEGHVFTKVRIPGEESVDLNQVLDPSVSIESFLNEK